MNFAIAGDEKSAFYVGGNIVTIIKFEVNWRSSTDRGSFKVEGVSNVSKVSDKDEICLEKVRYVEDETEVTN